MLTTEGRLSGWSAPGGDEGAAKPAGGGGGREGALGGGGTALSYHSRMQARYLTLRLDSVPRSADAAIAGVRQRREAHALSWISWGFYIWDW